MEKKFLRILSFVMVAAFAFTLMGLAVSAEEWDIPVIEEVTEEELGEELVEEEVVETFSEGDEAQIYSATGVAGATYATFEDALAAVEAGGKVVLLKDVTVLEGATTYITIGKKVTIDGGGHTLTDACETGITRTFHLDAGADVTVTNIKFLRPSKQSYGVFATWSGAKLTVSDNTVFENLAATFGGAIFVMNEKAVVNIEASYDSVAPRFINCTNGGAVCVLSGTLNLSRGIFTDCGNDTTAAINIGRADKDGNKVFNMTGGTINSKLGVQVIRENVTVNITGGTITGGTIAGIKIMGDSAATIGGTASITGNTVGILLESRTSGGTTYKGATVTVEGSATLSNNTTGINATCEDAVVTVKENATISGGTTGVKLATTATLNVEGSTIISGTTSGVTMADAGSIKVTGTFSGQIGVTVNDAANKIQLGVLEEGGSIADGASFYSDADNNIKFTRYGDCKGTGTGNGKTLVNMNFTSNVLDADALILHYNWMVVSGGNITGATMFSADSNKTHYLLRDVNYTEAISTAGWMDFWGKTGVVMDGNGFTITRDDTGSQNVFAVINGADVTFRNLVFKSNANGSRFAYAIETAATSPGAKIHCENCLFYNGNTAGGGALMINSGSDDSVIELHDVVITGCKSGIVANSGTIKLSGKLDISDNINGTTARNVVLGSTARLVIDGDISDTTGNITKCVGITTDNALLGTIVNTTSDASLACIYSDSGSDLEVVRYDSFVGTGESGGHSLVDMSVINAIREAHKGEIWFNYPVYRVNGNAVTGHKKISEAISLTTANPYSVYMTKDMAVNEAFNTTAAGHVDLNGAKTVTIYGNGHTMTRTHKGNNIDNFTIYGGINISFKDLLYDGGGISHFAYIINDHGGAAITVDNCVLYNGYHTAYGSAIGLMENTNSSTLNLKDSVITGNKGNGAIYLSNSHAELNLSGKLDIKDNTNSGGTIKSNIVIAASAKINMTGDITDADGGYTPSVGITLSNGVTFGEAAETGYKGVDCFFADNAPVTVTGSYYAETIGDGTLNGNTVMTNPRSATGKEKTLVLHYPWLLVSPDGTTETGYVSFNTLKGSYTTEDSRAIMQKSMVAKNMTVYDANEITGQLNITEFPLKQEGMYFNHTGKNLIIDGNGHVLTSETSGSTPIFVIYSGGKISFENLIYNGAGIKRLARIYDSSPANGDEIIKAKNCYLENGTNYVFEGNMHGLIEITDSTLSGMDVKTGCQTVLDNVTFTGTIGSAVSVTGTVTLNDVSYVSTVTVKNGTNLPKGSWITLGDANVKLVLDSTYTGEFTVDMANFGNIGNQISTSGLDKLESRMSVVKRNSTDFAYVDSYTDGVGTLKWAKVPELGLATDSGKYDDETGLIRFMTTFTKAPINAVENYGTYVIGVSNFEGDPAGITKFGKFENAPTKDGQAYIVDVINIPSDKMDEDITAISFVKIKGITTPIYSYFGTVNFNTAAANGVVKDLGKKA